MRYGIYESLHLLQIQLALWGRFLLKFNVFDLKFGFNHWNCIHIVDILNSPFLFMRFLFIWRFIVSGIWIGAVRSENWHGFKINLRLYFLIANVTGLFLRSAIQFWYGNGASFKFNVSNNVSSNSFNCVFARQAKKKERKKKHEKKIGNVKIRS